MQDERQILKSRPVGYARLDSTQGWAQEKGSKGCLRQKRAIPYLRPWLLFAVLVAAVVRWYGLAAHSLWFDEGYSS